MVKVAKENNLGMISPILGKNLAVEPSIERIKNIKNVEVSRVQSVKCVVRLPDPKNMNIVLSQTLTKVIHQAERENKGI